MKNENLRPHEGMCLNVGSSFIYRSEKIRNNFMCLSMRAWTNTLWDIHAAEYYAATKKEQPEETCNNRGTFQEHWAKRKKTGTRDYMLHKSIYVTFQNK